VLISAVGLPIGVQIAGWVFATILFLGACAGGYYLVRGQKISAVDTRADSAVASLTGELAASNSRIDRVEDENRHLREINAQQKVLNESLAAQLKDLREWVTARDLIEGLDAKMERGFTELGVALERLRR
jgi:cell shape-determining protein MreC